jgi:LacI family transcriptional regulator
MKEKATLKQIAKELNVSVSTVSKALNDSAEISGPTKIKIQEFAKLKNYKPNITALNLKNRSTKTIGVIVPTILNPFFVRVISGIEKTADEKGYNIIISNSNETIEKEIHALEILNNGTVDGFILSVSEESQKKGIFGHFVETIKDGTPIVMFDRIVDEVDCDKVIVDDLESSSNAVSYLIQQKCKKITFLSAIKNLSVSKLRFNGYVKSLKEHHLDLDTNLIIVEEDSSAFDKKLKKLFQEQVFDAIFAVDNHASAMAAKFAIENGISIPNQLLLIGFADGVWARRLTPSLTTISQNGHLIGEAAVKLLIERFEDNENEVRTKSKTVIINTQLKHRESTIK